MSLKALKSLSSFTLLPELNLTKVTSRKPWGIIFHCEKTSDFEVCPKCARKASVVYDKRIATYKDEPIRGKAVILSVKKRRFLCKTCNKTFTEPIPGISKGKRTTNRFSKSLQWASENFLTMSAVSKFHKCSPATCFKAVTEHVKRRCKARRYPLPSAIGIDEHSIRKPKHKGVQFATIIVDHDHDRVYDLIDDHSKAGLANAMEGMEGKENVKHVTIDLSPTFKSLVKTVFPAAQIIADRFHVQRLFSRTVNAMRKKVTGDKRKNPIRKLLLRNQDDLESHEKKAVRLWLSQNPEVREVYDYKEGMRRIYRMKSPSKACIVFNRLLEKMKSSQIERVKLLRKTLISWRKEILAYHLTHLSNGRTEGFNRKAKLYQRAGYGVRSFENYKWKLINACF